MITSLHHYALTVPELDVADTFLQGFGLDTAAEAGALVARCPGRDQEQVRMLEGPVKKLHHVAFTVSSLDEVRGRLDRTGVPTIDPPDGGTDVGLWVRDPDGTPVQLIDTAPTPARSVAQVHANVGATYTRFDTAGWLDTQDVLPRRRGWGGLRGGRAACGGA